MLCLMFSPALPLNFLFCSLGQFSEERKSNHIHPQFGQGLKNVSDGQLAESKATSTTTDFRGVENDGELKLGPTKNPPEKLSNFMHINYFLQRNSVIINPDKPNSRLN